MTLLLKEEVEKIGDYELSVEHKAIKRKSHIDSVDICTAAQVALTLKRYGLDYHIDDEFNFTIVG